MKLFLTGRNLAGEEQKPVETVIMSQSHEVKHWNMDILIPPHPLVDKLTTNTWVGYPTKVKVFYAV